MPGEAKLTVELKSTENVATGPPRQPYTPPGPAAGQPGAFDILMGKAGSDHPLFGALKPKAPEEKSFLERLFKPSSPESRQQAAMMSMGLGMAGMHAPAAVAGGYSALGPAGAALAAVDQIGKQLKQISDSVLKPMVSLDPNALAHGFAQMASKVPIVGSLLGPLASGILGLSDAVFATAKRLSEFSGPLAMQQAMIEVRNIQRDIERAQRMGPQLGGAVEARYQFEQRLQDVIDEHMGTIIKLMETGLDVFTAVLDGIRALQSATDTTNIAAGFSGIMMSLNDLVGNVPGGEFWMGVLEHLGVMARNSHPPVGNIIPGLDIRTIMANIFAADPQRRTPPPAVFQPPPAFGV